MAMSLTAKKKVIAARAGLILDAPFFGNLALRLNVKEDLSCKTAWTDSISLGFNPEFIDGLTLDETKGLVAHEVSHCMFSHHTRRNGRNVRKWNEAGDYVINLELIAAGVERFETLSRHRKMGRTVANQPRQSCHSPNRIGR